MEISQHAVSLKIQNISRYWGLTVRNRAPPKKKWGLSPINQRVKKYYAVIQYNSSSFLIACSRIARVLPLSASWRTKSSSGLTSSNASKGSRFSLAFNTSTGKRGLFIATIHHSPPQGPINFCRQCRRRCMAIVKCTTELEKCKPFPSPAFRQRTPPYGAYANSLSGCFASKHPVVHLP